MDLVNDKNVVNVEDMQEEIAHLRQIVANFGARAHIDATPDGNYALRILRAYRESCGMRYATNTQDIHDDDPFICMLNDLQRSRAKELDDAIDVLETTLR